MDESSKHLEDMVNQFVVPLRTGDGLSEEHFNALKDALRMFHANWSSSETLPKSAVVFLIDLPRIVESCAPLYEGDERQRIVDVSQELVDVILEGF